MEYEELDDVSSSPQAHNATAFHCNRLKDDEMKKDQTIIEG